MISNQGHQENQVNHGLDGGRETVQGAGSQGGDDVRVAKWESTISRKWKIVSGILVYTG